MEMATQIEQMLASYIETALWSSTDDNSEPFDSNYSPDDLAPETVNQMRADCESFAQGQAATIDDLDIEQVAHDFWLTRNGHGAGFWDGDYAEPAATVLTAASKGYGEVNLYVGDDGLIYQM